MTPAHQIDLTRIQNGERVLGIVEFSVMKAEQKLSPPKEITNPEEPHTVLGVSYYGETHDPFFICSKEIICRIDLDMAAHSSAAVNASAVTYTYKETIGNFTGETGTTEFATAFIYYKTSNIFMQSNGLPYNNWLEKEIIFNKRIAYEECSLTYMHSEVETDEDVDEEWKKRYYKIFKDNLNRNKTIKMEVAFTSPSNEPSISFILYKVIGDREERETDTLNSLIKSYNGINLHEEFI